MITITLPNTKIEYDPKLTPKESLLSILRNHGVYLSAPCNGQGKCGKCSFTLLEGSLAVSDSDRAFFSEAELTAGKRLACTAYPDADIRIALSANSAEEGFEILSSSSASFSDTSSNPSNPAYGVAIDIGTTTIAAVLLDLTTGVHAASASSLNHQRTFGADVLSRIQSANDGHLAALHESIVCDLRSLLLTLFEKVPDSFSHLCNIVIGANTTMVHLLMNASCETLGTYPFSSVNLGPMELSAKKLLGDSMPACTVCILPGISTFVGGDIVSGIYASGLAASEELSFLVDLGTNGEIALGNCNKILVASTAAGPAFEGGNISCGTGSIKGAVSNVNILGGRPVVNLIGDAHTPACGICGTGVVAITSALLHHKLIDATGRFTADYPQGYPFAKNAAGKTLFFTQSDVREIQLAKAAICAGMEILMLRYGVKASDISTVAIAGGFGQKLDLKKALSIGLFPDGLAGKINAIGNSCLDGAIETLLSSFASQTTPANAPALHQMQECRKKSAEISLSTDPDFHSRYLNNLNFF